MAELELVEEGGRLLAQAADAPHDELVGAQVDGARGGLVLLLDEVDEREPDLLARRQRERDPLAHEAARGGAADEGVHRTSLAARTNGQLVGRRVGVEVGVGGAGERNAVGLRRLAVRRDHLAPKGTELERRSRRLEKKRDQCDALLKHVARLHARLVLARAHWIGCTQRRGARARASASASAGGSRVVRRRGGAAAHPHGRRT